jgi:hypothetical protein
MEAYKAKVSSVEKLVPPPSCVYLSISVVSIMRN